MIRGAVLRAVKAAAQRRPLLISARRPNCSAAKKPLFNSSFKLRTLTTTGCTPGKQAEMAPVISPGEDVAAAVTRWIAESNVIVFSKTTCPFCIKLKTTFKAKRIDFTTIELDTLGETGPAIQDELATKTGQRTVPNVFIRGQHRGV